MAVKIWLLKHESVTTEKRISSVSMAYCPIRGEWREPSFFSLGMWSMVYVTCGAERNKMSLSPHCLTRLSLTQPDHHRKTHLSRQCRILHRKGKRDARSCWFYLSHPPTITWIRPTLVRSAEPGGLITVIREPFLPPVPKLQTFSDSNHLLQSPPTKGVE